MRGAMQAADDTRASIVPTADALTAFRLVNECGQMTSDTAQVHSGNIVIETPWYMNGYSAHESPYALFTEITQYQ